MARREKKPVHEVVVTDGKRNIIQQLLQEYDIETAKISRMRLRICLAAPSKKGYPDYLC